jgi:metal-dependent amidase/aminoacylase/carboxypeptidase family protein
MATATHTPSPVLREERRVIQVIRRRAGIEESCEVTVMVRAPLTLTDQQVATVIQTALASAGQRSGQEVTAVDPEANAR